MAKRVKEIRYRCHKCGSHHEDVYKDGWFAEPVKNCRNCGIEMWCERIMEEFTIPLEAKNETSKSENVSEEKDTTTATTE